MIIIWEDALRAAVNPKIREKKNSKHCQEQFLTIILWVRSESTLT